MPCLVLTICTVSARIAEFAQENIGGLCALAIVTQQQEECGKLDDIMWATLHEYSREHDTLNPKVRLMKTRSSMCT